MMMHRPQFDKSKPAPKGGFKKMMKSLRRYYPALIISVACVITSVILAILAPQYLSDLTNEIANNSVNKNINMGVVWNIATTLIIFYSVSTACSIASGMIMNVVTNAYGKSLRSEIINKLNRLPLSYFDSHQYGDTLSVVSNDVDTVTQSLQQSVNMLVSSVFMLVGVVIAMFITNWIMALTTLISLPLMILMIVFVTRLAVPQFRNRQKHTGIVNGIVEENFTGATIIKLFNAEKKRQDGFDKENEELHKAMIKAQIFGGLMQPISMFISYFTYAAVCLVGGLLMAYNMGITFGTITAFLVYINLFQSPLSQISQAMNSVQMATAASSRVFELLDTAEVINDDNVQRALLSDTFNNVKGAIEFKNVHFGYVEGKTIIEDFNCKVEPGMKVAIVGPTGAGKTTLVNLLMRFYEIGEGDILIDGVSIHDMSKAEIRDIFGMVLQDSWIFDGTLRDNIVYSKKNVTNEQLEKALEEASLAHYVSTLPNGVDTMLHGDSSLSQGQKQLITIARAIVSNSPLLILDEATSNVDTRTEILIQQAMDNLSSGRTSFVIAHRLSTIKNADLILVLKDGNIIEQGNHEKLMEANGFYANLYNSQFIKESREIIES